MRFNNFNKKTECFIETGSYIGQGIQLALNSGFSKVYSIELTDHFYEICRKKFQNDDRVQLIKGDSFYKLKELLDENPNTQFTYWLDGHYSGGNTGFGVKESPLLQELEVILSRNIQGELVYVDDMRMYRAFDEELNITSIENLIKKYKPNATATYEATRWDAEDIMVIDY